MTLVKYTGATRFGYAALEGVKGRRIPVQEGSKGRLIERSTAGCLVEFRVGGERVRFWAPRWQLRKLVKR